MNFLNSNAFFTLFLVVLLRSGPSYTQELEIEISKECQHFCDVKRPKRSNGPYLLTCYDNDCTDVSCEVHKCPSTICKNGRTIFCPSTKGSYHSSSRALNTPVEAAPATESEYDNFTFVFWAFSAFIIIGICCALISWNSSRKSKPEGHMPAGYIHAHQDEYRRPEKSGGGGCFLCCSRANEDQYYVQRQQRGERPSIMYLEDDEDEDRRDDQPYSFDDVDRMPSQATIRQEVSATSINKDITMQKSTTVIQSVPSASSISVIKPPPPPVVQASQTNIPSMSLKIAESASSIEEGGMEDDTILITYRRSSN